MPHTDLPPEPNVDNMVNNWGTGLIQNERKYAESTPDLLDGEIRKAVPGFKLIGVLESGTGANDRAISLATGANYTRCLFAMGSYSGGTGILQTLSSTQMTTNWQISLVQHPQDCSLAAQEQTVAMPYHIPHRDLMRASIQEMEKLCLDSLNVKLMHAVLRGRPYKAMLLEYILSGSGGELSVPFLLELAKLLKQYNVTIIADEIMTGGRCGPTMAITTALPTEFIERVGFVTLGKVVSCGLVLVRAKDNYEKSRGTSTELEVGEAFYRFTTIAERIFSGFIDLKLQKVFKAIKLDPDLVWGRGLLLFSNKARSGLQRGLKNRMLPTLEHHGKTRIQLGFTDTPWTKAVVHALLFEGCRSWMEHTQVLQSTQLLSPYMFELAKYISHHPRDEEQIYPSNYMAQIESSQEPELLALHKERKRRRLGPRNGRCNASHKKLVFDSLSEAAETSNGFLTRTLKTKKRRLCYITNYENIS